MKIVVISDTHLFSGIADFPEKLLKDIKGADLVIHTGDFVEEKVFGEIEKISREFKAVAGNMDSEELKRRLPEKLIFKAGKYRIGITHGRGAPSDLLNALGEIFSGDKLDLIIFGHSHLALNKKIGDTVFFNPGSPVDKIYAESNSYGIIEINGGMKLKIEEI